MLIALGFFTAALVCFLLAPYYRRRSARLATDELKRSMPLTTAEIRADKDRLRAEFAITIHKLESKVEQANFAAARQLVEINRRDAAISALEGEVGRMRTFLDEYENARRVLEQTITERLPKVEHRLAQAKQLLEQRDKEIAELSRSSSKHAMALEEATQINAQQRDEIHRLNATLTMHAARNRENLRDPRFDAEVALRAEIEALRAKTRDQAALIGRLQSTQGVTSADGTPQAARSEGELQRLSKDLAEAELALKSVTTGDEAAKAIQGKLETEIRTLRAENRDQSAEIANLKAALKSYEDNSADDRAIKESKLALKARLSALQAQAEEQTATIQTLRAEVAAANEKLARQAAHFMDEMRRLGAGTVPVTGPSRRPQYEPPKRASLSERINAPRAQRSASEETVEAVATLERPAAEARAAGGFLRTLETPLQDAAEDGTTGSRAVSAANGEEHEQVQTAAQPKARRPGLLERITGLEKPA
jgi:chromosome segregation ATPase